MLFQGWVYCMMISSIKASMLGSAYAILHIRLLTHKLLLEEKFKTDKLEGARIKVVCATLIHSLRYMHDNVGFNYMSKLFSFCRKSASFTLWPHVLIILTKWHFSNPSVKLGLLISLCTFWGHTLSKYLKHWFLSTETILVRKFHYSLFTDEDLRMKKNLHQKCLLILGAHVNKTGH